MGKISTTVIHDDEDFEISVTVKRKSDGRELSLEKNDWEAVKGEHKVLKEYDITVRKTKVNPTYVWVCCRGICWWVRVS